jgi:hypothetical protein
MNKSYLMSLVILIMVSACFSGCMPTRQEVLSEWKGHSISEAIAKLGPPSYTTPLPGNVTIYVWEDEYGTANSISRAKCLKGLHVNAEGIIIDASQHSGSAFLCK